MVKLNRVNLITGEASERIRKAQVWVCLSVSEWVTEWVTCFLFVLPLWLCSFALSSHHELSIFPLPHPPPDILALELTDYEPNPLRLWAKLNSPTFKLWFQLLGSIEGKADQYVSESLINCGLFLQEHCFGLIGSVVTPVNSRAMSSLP